MSTANGIKSPVAERMAPFGTTIFTEMTMRAIERQAVNLSQGFPDEDGPDFIKQAAAEAMQSGENQYARMFGIPDLNDAIADRWRVDTGSAVDPDTEVTVTDGCTEGLSASFLGCVNPGDEVILFQPHYDSYRACAAMAGAKLRFVTLRPPQTDGSAGVVRKPFTFDEAELRGAFGPKTRAIVVNTPHNPTGKVFTREELGLIADLCIEHDVIAITDEVYERLTFSNERPHIRLATLPGMAERTISISSLGKTFSLTGWKIGWTIASPALTKAVRSAHQFLTFSVATPLQHGAAAALRRGDGFVSELAGSYRERRDMLASALANIGFPVFLPDGTYFLLADHTSFGAADDVEFCRSLIEEQGVAAIPVSAFCDDPEAGRPLVRFAFCKERPILEEAIKRMYSLRRA